MMRREAPGLCPVCYEKLYVTKLACHRCNTRIEGDFEPCKFCALSIEQKAFIEVFVKNRGNIKEVERELGISYPTVRSRLDNVLVTMGYGVEPEVEREREDASSKRRSILDALSRGEINSDDAIKLLRSL